MSTPPFASAYFFLCNYNLSALFSYRLVIACENVSYGCSQLVKLDVLESHLDTCEHNPKRPVPCEQGCGLVIPVDELKEHNCVRELRSLIQSYQQKMADFQQELADHRTMVNNQKRELHIIKVRYDFLQVTIITDVLRRRLLNYGHV